ncbi:glycosyltransferase family 9 protein [Acetobacter orleanensis]|uniref:Glycosyl transferase n=1 Tax=Acetobacter orleanensis TaxID=104099 RepID=A0A4Y3TPM2_9PROT|nr:glycosyltransferase family 9 protein [Acetobacter orleanensis]KXV64314.1 heptosyltransferase [Acetobacter orleanensis]PCD79140.1 glycosyltransferase family 9 protein [Acetobacter orleanensis]GAN69446.1 lipopolysaccharide heptosyl transferase/glycosyl transferase [Acetobacter orleanensis JCM 7639]GEB82950.1 glycosyl transferase [Acetobacter orleanensis]
MRILFITATRLGDAVLSTGLLAHLVRTYPDARFTIACGPVAAGLFQNLPGLERVLVMTKRTYDRHWLELWKACIGQTWDLTIDLRGSATTFFLRSRKRLIMRGGRRPGLRLNHLGQLLHLSPPPMPTVWLSEADKTLASQMIPTDGGPIIALGPTANWTGKIWPIDRYLPLWAELSRQIPSARPAIFYGPGEQERALALPVLHALPNAIDAGGHFSLTQVAAMLAQCRLFIGNDSGLMHLAAAAGTPTLGLFGPSRASEYAPSGRSTSWVVAPGPEGEAPIAGLSLERVTQVALTVLAETKS